MRYTIAYWAAATIAVVGGILLVRAFALWSNTGSELERQQVLMYVVSAGALFAASVQFVVLGHLLTEIAALREDMKQQRPTQ